MFSRNILMIYWKIIQRLLNPEDWCVGRFYQYFKKVFMHKNMLPKHGGVFMVKNTTYFWRRSFCGQKHQSSLGGGRRRCFDGQKHENTSSKNMSVFSSSILTVEYISKNGAWPYMGGGGRGGGGIEGAPRRRMKCVVVEAKLWLWLWNSRFRLAYCRSFFLYIPSFQSHSKMHKCLEGFYNSEGTLPLFWVSLGAFTLGIQS